MYIILGAGIAGLSAAYFLRQRGLPVLVLEQSASYGGLARSFRWHDIWCDFSAHRLFVDDPQVLAQLQRLVPLRELRRRSQIVLGGRRMRDPIDVLELALRLPPRSAARLAAGYVTRPRGGAGSFEAYVVSRYGRPLYELFFRGYTERLFSLPGQQIDVSWARRKVRLASPLDRFRHGSKTRFARFFYPRQGGYGAIATALYDEVRDHVLLGARVTRLERDQAGRVLRVGYQREGQEHAVAAGAVVSTLPLTATARLLQLNLALSYQKVDAVYLLLERPQLTENHWLYFMDADATINRLVEFKQLSDDHASPTRTVVCAEVTREVEDPLAEVVADLSRAGLAQSGEVLDAKVIREPFAYPRYARGYPGLLRACEETMSAIPNLHLLGRAAQFAHLEVDDIVGAAARLVSSLATPAPYALAASAGAPERGAGDVPAVAGPTEDVAAQARGPAEVWVVVLAWNNYDDTAECLASLRQLSYPNVRLLLVDNGSSDGTPERARAAFPELTVLENGANLGVPRGYNAGFRHALAHGAQYIFMINNDTTVDPHMLQPLLAAAQEPGAGVLAPVVYYYDHPTQVWASGARYRRMPPAIIMRRDIVTPRQGYHELEYAISCGLLITRRAFEQAGLFDENYRFLWDDYDFSERVRRAGLRILHVPTARMWHKVSRTTRPGSTLFWEVHAESGAIFYRRFGRLLALPVHLGYIGLREFLFKRRWRFLRPYLAGLRQGLRRQLKPVPRVKDGAPFPG